MRCIYQWSRRLIMFADYNIKSVIIWCCNICLEWRIRLYRFNVMLSLTVKSSRRAIKKLFIMKGFFCFYITHVYVSFERGRCGHILGLFYADNPRICLYFSVIGVCGVRIIWIYTVFLIFVSLPIYSSSH